MEFLLLWVDELDDAVGALRHLIPRVLGFLFAAALFAGTGFVLLLAPDLVLGAFALILSAALAERMRRRLNPPRNETRKAPVRRLG